MSVREIVKSGMDDLHFPSWQDNSNRRNSVATTLKGASSVVANLGKHELQLWW